MSYYTKLEEDFIERTFKIIEQYDTLVTNKEEKYEVTLLINSFFGIISILKEDWIQSSSTNYIERINDLHNVKLELKNYKFIEKNQKEKKINTNKEFLSAVRNGICHWRENTICEKIKFSTTEEGNIGEIVIEGSLKYQHVLDLTFTHPEGLKTFLLFLRRELKVK